MANLQTCAQMLQSLYYLVANSNISEYLSISSLVATRYNVDQDQSYMLKKVVPAHEVNI